MSTGLVTGTHRRHFEVELTDDPARGRHVCTIRGRSLSPACGDIVDIERIDQQGTGEGIITAIQPRQTELTRADAYKQKTIAANVTLIVGVVAVEPAFNPELIDRWSATAEAAGCRFALVLNKTDLPGADAASAALGLYVKLGYTLLALSAKRDTAQLRSLIDGQHAVLIGQSGMGKSTIINALTGTTRAKTGDISAALNAGRHTTTSTQLYRIDASTWIVDSPGMKEFGVYQLKEFGLDRTFIEFRPLLGQCRFRNCVHDSEPGCVIRAATEHGTIAASRFETYHRLRRELQ